MAKIVMVHGAGNELWGPASIKARWYPALADGLAYHGVSIEPEDVAFAFYGDLFRPDPEREYEPPVDTATAMATIGQVLQAMDPSIDLDELTKLLTEQHLDRMLTQADGYLTNHDVRESARARIAACIADDTRVVVAHSLGTIVAYETLCERGAAPATHLVTMGSPLAGDIIFAALEPPTTDGRGAWPDGLVAWTNVIGTADPACRGPLEGKFAGPVVDRRVDNGHRVHDPEPYLNNPTTGAAVAAALQT